MFQKEEKMGKCDRNNKENLILESAHIKQIIWVSKKLNNERNIDFTTKNVSSLKNREQRHIFSLV